MVPDIAFLVDTPHGKIPVKMNFRTSGKASGVSPVQGGIVPPPLVLTSNDVLSAICISKTLLRFYTELSGETIVYKLAGRTQHRIGCQSGCHHLFYVPVAWQSKSLFDCDNQ